MSTNAVIKDLVQTLEDGRKGFTDAAGRLADDGRADLARRFEQFAEQRERFSAELRAACADAGVSIEEDGSIGGALHRGWIGLKDALTGDDAEAVVTAAETGEEHAVKEYDKALEDDDLPETLAETVRRQAAEIRSARDEVAALSSN